MKYYIPTTSLNFNNILSTESLSPKVFYDKRGFGYSRWFTVEENCIEYITLLYGTPHMFERPVSDIEDHPMLLEIDTDETFPQLAEGVFYTDRTIYLNPWQTKFIFFSEKDRTTAMSLSDSSLETKLVRLYKRKISVYQFEGTYPIVKTSISIPTGDINKYVEDDYIINKMKGLLYGYYIGANLSSTKEYVQKLDSLREIQNIFYSVLSSYDKVPSKVQRNRLNELFDYLDSLNPIYADLEKEVGNKQLVDRIFNVFKRYGYVFTSIDRSKLMDGLQEDGENNQSVEWVNREITHTRALIKSSITNLNPDDGEIIVSPSDKVVKQKVITDRLLSKLFINWINDVFCSKSFNGNVNSIKEGLSDEITKSAKNVIGVEWDNSPIRTYLNQLRHHVRGEEFNQLWDNGLLSSISAVLIKGDEWEQLLNFMQSKGMYDYRIAFAFYGVLNGFANLTRDFTDLLLNKESNYVSKVYREIYGQLFDKTIPETPNSSSDIEPKKQENYHLEENVQNLVIQNTEKKTVIAEYSNDADMNNGKSRLGKTIGRTMDSFKEFIGVNPSYKDFPECLVTVFNSESFEKIKPVGQDWYKNEALKLWDEYKTNSLEFQKALLSLKDKCHINGTKGHWEKSVKLIKPSKKKTSNKKTSNSRIDNTFDKNSLFYQTSLVESSGVFLKDYNFLISNSDFMSIASLCSSAWKEDLRWFIDAHNPTHKDYKYYENKSVDNRTIVNQFLRFKNERYKRTEQILKSIYTL